VRRVVGLFVIALMAPLAWAVVGSTGVEAVDQTDSTGSFAPSADVALRRATSAVFVSNLGALYPGEPAPSAAPEKTLSRFDEWVLPPVPGDARTQTVLFGSFSAPRMDPAKGDASLTYTPPEPGYLLIAWNVPQVNESTGHVFAMTHVSQYDSSGRFLGSVSQEAKDAGSVDGVPLTQESVLAHSVPLDTTTG